MVKVDDYHYNDDTRTCLHRYTVDFTCVRTSRVCVCRCVANLRDKTLHGQVRNALSACALWFRTCPWSFLSRNSAMHRHTQTRNVRTQVKSTVTEIPAAIITHSKAWHSKAWHSEAWHSKAWQSKAWLTYKHRISSLYSRIRWIALRRSAIISLYCNRPTS